jgi:hypothetical protein
LFVLCVLCVLCGLIFLYLPQRTQRTQRVGSLSAVAVAAVRASGDRLGRRLLRLWTLWPQPQVSGFAIQFVGFTNALGQPQSAVFAVTNVSRRTITFVTPETQVRTNGVWSELVVVGPLPIRPVSLPRGQGTIVTVAAPNRGEAWRMAIIWYYELSTAEIYLGRAKNLLRTAKEGSLSGWKYGFALTSYTNFSAEMELTKAEPSSPANKSQPIRSENNRTSSAADSRR